MLLQLLHQFHHHLMIQLIQIQKDLLNLHYSIHLYLVIVLQLFLDHNSFFRYCHMQMVYYYWVFLFLHCYNILILLYYFQTLLYLYYNSHLHNKIFLYFHHMFHLHLHHNQMHPLILAFFLVLFHMLQFFCSIISISCS